MKKNIVALLILGNYQICYAFNSCVNSYLDFEDYNPRPAIVKAISDFKELNLYPKRYIEIIEKSFSTEFSLQMNIKFKSVLTKMPTIL